ncbi:MAG TPA: rod-binding protein [bacterium]|jgi:flagellar protein FlgJ|nr:rod-binding protein [bacterium]
MTRPVSPLVSSDFQAPDLSAEWSTRMETAQAASEARAVGMDAEAAKATKGVDPKQLDQLRKVSQDFESVFLSYMMKVGRDTTSKGGFWGHSQGEEIFTSMRDDELAKHMAKAGGIGLAKLLVEQLTRTLQEQANNAKAASEG